MLVALLSRLMAGLGFGVDDRCGSVSSLVWLARWGQVLVPLFPKVVQWLGLRVNYWSSPVGRFIRLSGGCQELAAGVAQVVDRLCLRKNQGRCSVSRSYDFVKLMIWML